MSNIFRKGNQPPPPKHRFKGSGLLVMALVGAAVVGITSLSMAKANAIAINSIGSNKLAMQAQQYASAKGELYRTMKYSELTAQAKKDIQNSNGFQDEVTVSAETDYPDDSTVKQKLCTVMVYKTGESVPRSTLVVTRYSKSMDASSIPSGSIIHWYGNIADIPDGFALCNGTNGTPDLRDKFIVGAGSTYALSATGGADTVKLTGTQIGNHYHAVGQFYSNNNGRFLILNSGSWNYTFATANLPPNVSTSFWNGSGGGAGLSGHISSYGYNQVTSLAVATAAQESHENRPPYYALHYIMKL